MQIRETILGVSLLTGLMALGLGLGLGLAACSDDDSPAGPDAGPFKSLVEPDPALDEVTVILNGPYLHAPAEGTVTVSWETDVPTTSRVELTPEGGSPEVVEGIVFQQLPTTDNEILIGMPHQTYQHEVVLTGLVPGARYDYRVLSALGTPGAQLVGPPALGEGMSFVMFGDTRTNPADHANVIDGILAQRDVTEHPAFVINTGDLTNTGANADDWAEFFSIEAPLISEVPLLSVFGNHEFYLGRTIFEAYFQAPPTSTSTSDRYYSMDLGNVHLVVVDMGTMAMEPHDQWVEDDLAASTAPFKLVALHGPIYTNSRHDPDIDARDMLGPIFEAQGVQAVIAGHNHCYERFVAHGSHYITAGGGGAPLYDADEEPGADNADAVKEASLSAYNFLWVTTTDADMTIEAFVSADATTPVTESYDCVRILANEPVTTTIPCN